MGISALAIFLSIGVSLVSFRKEPPERRKVLRFATIFSNAGFMGIPLVQGIVGERGVVYGSFFIAVFNVICWTYGYRMMSGGAKVSLRTVLLNPGIIGLAVGLPLYFLGLPAPRGPGRARGLLLRPEHPPGHAHHRQLHRQGRPALLRLRHGRVPDGRLAAGGGAPALFLACLLLLRPEPVLLVTSVIQASAPVAANTVLFAVQYGGDSQLASKTVAVSTVLSILTIPLFTILAQLACQFLF